MQNLGLTVTEELRIPLTLPGGRRCLLYRFGIEAPAERIAALREGEQRFVDALRALDEERATDDPLNGLILVGGARAGATSSCCARCATTCCRSARTGTPRRSTACWCATARPRARSIAPSRRASTRRCRAIARRAVAEADAGFTRALDGVAQPGRRRGAARASPTWCARRCAPTPTSGRSGRCSRSRSTARRSRRCASPRPLFEIYVHSRRLEGIHLRGGKVARGGIRWTRPPRRLPHRDPRADEDADGQELGDRAGRLEGRLRAEGRRAAAPGARRVPDRPLPRVRLGPARRDRQPRRRQGAAPARGGAATTATTPTWWSPPTRARRTCRTPPTASRRSTASGSATRSPRAAAWATTTRRWASPRAAPGSASSTTSATWGSTCRRSPFTVAGVGDMSGDVFGNGVLLSRVIKLVAAFDHRHIFIDPDPDPEASFARARADVRAAALELARLRRDAASARAAASSTARPRRSRSRPRRRKLLDDRRRGAVGRGGDPQDPDRAASTCSTTAASAPTSRPPSEEHADVGDRANDRVRVNGERAAGAGGRRGRQPRAHAEGPPRVLGGAAAGSTPTPSTTRAASTSPTTR